MAVTGAAPATGSGVEVALELRSLTRRFGKVVAVRDLSLAIPARAFVTLLGPSGCGKSTTLAAIAGLERPDGGQILLGGRDITHDPPNARQMAMVFQNYALYPHKTVYENIAFGLKLQHRSRAEIEERVGAIAEALDIQPLLRRKPAQLSGGQQQRVALGRALVKEPAVFLLDEPFSNLDASLRARMRSEVKRLHQSLGTTSIFVTHDQEEAMALSDYIAIMRDGEIVQWGTPREIYRRPVNTYVAGFVGKPRMSFVRGKIDQTPDGARLVGDGLRIELGNRRVEAGREVTAGIRAEDAALARDGAPGIDAVVEIVEPIGADTFVDVRAGDATLVVRAHPDVDVSPGSRVRVAVVPQAVHLFDADGTRLDG
jgi:multiple sugar transport system ATP-binding protein